MKVRCISASSICWTVGKVYEMTDNGIKSDSGMRFSAFLKDIYSGTLLERWHQFSKGTVFEEVKEMTKSDLKVNDVLVFERDRALIVSCDAEKELAWFSGGGDLINVIGEDLQKVSTNIGGKLVNVYRPRHRGSLGNILKGEYSYCDLLWERQEKSEAQIKLDKLIADKEAYDKEFNKQVEDLRKEIKEV